MPRAMLVFILLVLLAVLAAPLPPGQQPPGPWSYPDLRLLDPPDAPTPQTDLGAIYLRQAGGGLEIRLEMLDVSPGGGVDLFIAIDSGQAGEMLVSLPERGPLQVLDPAGTPAPPAVQLRGIGTGRPETGRPAAGRSLRIIRDSVLDVIEIHLEGPGLQGLSPGLTVQVYTALPGVATPADISETARLDAPPPPRLKTILAFWNTYPAYTPAQAVRRWDGAHTGPHGVRHGLFNLLRTARNRRIPLLVLDLKAPASLAALEYGGDMGLVEAMAAAGLLGLPDVQTIPPGLPGLDPGLLAAAAARLSRKTALAHGLPAGRGLYTLPGAPVPQGYRAIYTRSAADLPACPGSQPPVLVTTRRAGLLELNFDHCTDPDQVNFAGLSLPARRGLLRAAADPAPGVLWLGGDLARSGWGEPSSARMAFEYIASRPWIEVLNESQLLSLPASGPGRRVTIDYTQNSDPAETRLARDLLAGLYGPLAPHPAELDNLRHAYSAQSHVLLQVYLWAQAPSPQGDCDTDFNGDGLQDCIIASGSVFAALDALSSGLTHLFVLRDGRLHQLVGASSQAVVGLGVPDTWLQAMNRWSDPQVIASGLALPGGAELITVSEQWVTFVGPAGERRYRLLENGLEITGSGAAATRISLPILADPWLRFQPDWASAYRAEEIPGGWRWLAGPGAGVSIRGDQPLGLTTFMDSQRFMGRSEDPNRDYPPGHFLPFPLALLEFGEAGPWRLALTWEEVP